jgi:hypothetical protein
MERLLVAGLVYLIVVAIVLIIKPRLMFTEDGTWKEFGIGRNPSTHTWLPFWLFSILWSLISYILVTIAFAVYGPKTVQDIEEAPEFTIPTPKKTRSKGKPLNLPNGYYMLNNDATEAAGGVPKYVYIGQGLPDDS